jgi:hypothetical protein
MLLAARILTRFDFFRSGGIDAPEPGEAEAP